MKRWLKLQLAVVVMSILIPVIFNYINRLYYTTERVTPSISEVTYSPQGNFILIGCEVKSLRLGRASLTDTYGSFEDGELFIENLKIEEYANRGYEKHEPNRKKKLLLTRHEINKIIGAMAKKGYSLVAKKLFFDARGRAKLEIGLGKGKKLYDKRESIKERDISRKLREW